jgi:hypothetical protein
VADAAHGDRQVSIARVAREFGKGNGNGLGLGLGLGKVLGLGTTCDESGRGE